MSQEPEMIRQDEALGRVVRAAVAEGLEHQRGRATAAFRASLAAQGGKEPPAVLRSHRLMQWWAGAASAIAACLAVVVTAQFLLKPHDTVPIGVETAAVPAVVDQVTYTRNVDGGTIALDGQTPARIVRQQTVRQTQWFDPKEKATYSLTEPVEKVEYVKINPY